jgi:acyl dehydratase
MCPSSRSRTDTAIRSAPTTEWASANDHQRLRTATRRITQVEIDTFAAVSGDHHPQHVDATWAASSMFGERVAHGMLVLSCAAGLVPLEPERVVALRHVDATFKRAVRPGDAIHVDVRATSERRLDSHHRLIASRWRILNQDDQLVALATVEVLWHDAPGSNT